MEDRPEIEINKRLVKLENTVFGHDPAKIVDTLKKGDIVNRVKEIDRKVNACIVKKPKVARALQESADLMKYSKATLHPETIPEATSIEMILSSEEHLMQIVKQFEKVEPLKKHLDSQHIHESHVHFKKMPHVANEIYDSRDDSNNFDKEMNALIVQYNEILDLVSKQLILYDRIVTAHETENL